MAAMEVHPGAGESGEDKTHMLGEESFCNTELETSPGPQLPYVNLEEETDIVHEKSKCNGQMRVLLLTAVLFFLITAAQVIGALASNSKALLMDCVSMAVDATTYTLNIGVECVKGRKVHTAAEMTVAAISLGVLVYFTIQVTVDTVPILIHHHHANATNMSISNSTTSKQSLQMSAESTEQVDVNAWITLAFAIGGIIVDLISLRAFQLSHQKTSSGKEMNMWTALMHVGADLIRSVTTLFSSLLMLIFGADTRSTDAWAAIVISITIFCGSLAGMVAWFRRCCKGVRSLRQGFGDGMSSRMLRPVPPRAVLEDGQGYWD